tara:strand:- start:5419 stop:6582 length:1164 start_codon:yes stop_codon:yes gene_type:complete
MRKVCVITGSRAEYGLLYWTIKGIKDDSSLNLQLIATGMHLSKEFGYTYNQIEKDGFVIDKKIKILDPSDSPRGISTTMGNTLIEFSKAFKLMRPDIILILGDRYEIFSVAAVAMIYGIPIAHCHGGESTEGVIDEPIRHSITKMSHLHFCSTEKYKNRIIQLGESKENIFQVGALGIESINKLKLFSKNQLSESLSFDIKNKNFFLITFHPVTLEDNSSKKQIKELLDALKKFTDYKIIFTKANSDTYGKIINKKIDDFVMEFPYRSISFKSLGQISYLSALKYCSCVIGNSSSGIIEAPSFKVPTVNIGDRQRGRIIAASVVNCKPIKSDILNAIKKVLSDDFSKNIVSKTINPYGQGNASKKIISVLKRKNLKNIIKKKFNDII